MNVNLEFRLYQITDSKLFSSIDKMLDVIEMQLDAGLKAVQLREKHLSDLEVFNLAVRLRNMTNKYSAKLFVNERVDIALCCEADGVHLGFSGMPLKAVRKICGEELMIFVSTHSMEQAKAAEAEGADLITFGPVFATPSKMRYGLPAGLKALSDVSASIKLPVFALGGIDLENLDDVLRTGVYGTAVIRAGLMSRNIKEMISKFENSPGDAHDKD
ncbi:MAG: thiamine phosphate synthase [Dissulfurispiraceae bacterium]|jgi:thiamine-phosphate pyrophosphorylase|nr:thiamine phosphate synthase [Dissulfurispiraceae bacterium]